MRVPEVAPVAAAVMVMVSPPAAGVAASSALTCAEVREVVHALDENSYRFSNIRPRAVHRYRYGCAVREPVARTADGQRAFVLRVVDVVVGGNG